MPPTKHNRRAAKKVLIASEALKLRAEGLRFKEIAERLECNKTTAWRAVVGEMAKLAAESREYADQILNRELVTTEILLDKGMEAVDEGDISAIAPVLKILARRARYLGLDKPTKVQAEVGGHGFLTKEQMLNEIMDRIKKNKPNK